MEVWFYDLREEEAAQERGVAPGYYLTVHPILESDLKDHRLISKLTLFLFKKLQEEGLLDESDIEIPIDIKGKLFVDPAQVWCFSPAGYLPKKQLLIVRADQIDRDEAQKVVVKALNPH